MMDNSLKVDAEDLYQISLLIDQMRHDDVHLRINATKCIGKIAQALGPERTRDELIPFLSESLDDEDDVLRTIAERLVDLLNYVGGARYYHCILQPLENLVTAEESIVRETAISTVEQIAKVMIDEDLCEHFVRFVTCLAGKDWFTSRMSAVSLFHVGFNRLPESVRTEFRKLFCKLCSDDTPMVRRIAAQSIGKFASIVLTTPGSTPVIQDELLACFNKLSNDDQDSVRIQVIGACVTIGEVIPVQVRVSQILPVVIHLGADRSWRVRWCFAGKLADICRVMGLEVSNNSLCNLMESLLKDAEAEVRSIAAGSISAVCSNFRKDNIISKTLPVSLLLVSDVSEHVRASLASSINKLAPLLGTQDTVEHLLPMLLQLLRDDNSEVRLSIISNLDVINSVIGVELLSQSLLPAIIDLAEDSKWRVRFAIIEHIPKLAEQLGCSFFNEKLNSMCMTWLGDEVYSIRRAAADNLRHLSNLFGEKWTMEHIVPKIERMHTHNNHSHRLTAVYGIQVLVQSVSLQCIEKTLLPILFKMVGDSVPNIRLAIARTIKDIVALQRASESKNLANVVSPILSTMTGDADRDVRFFAEKAMLCMSLSDQTRVI